MHCLYEENKELQQRIDKLEEENKMYAQLKDEYEDIINKAIKYIEYDLEITEHLYDSGSYDTNYIREELLEILKGSDKE